MTVLVTGGAGYFGEILGQKLVSAGRHVRILDLNDTTFSNVEARRGDIRDADAVLSACEGVDVVYHNVAQVPLAKDRNLFWTVNRDGMEVLLSAARRAGVRKVIYTSSSAVFGVPAANPVMPDTLPAPAEEYGRAKLAGEAICNRYRNTELDVTIIRPRTILGHGRLGILQILFDWVERGADVPVLDGGRKLYQFVHADDLADACIAAGQRPGSDTYNIGAERFGTMHELLTGLIQHAGTKSRIKSLPLRPIELGMNLASQLGLSPLGPYHALMYGRDMYFDIEHAKKALNYSPRYSNHEAICESYDWYIANKEQMNIDGSSPHKSSVGKGILAAVPTFLKLV